MGIQRKIVSLLNLLIILFQIGTGEGYMVGNNPNRQRVNLDSRGRYVLEWQVYQKDKRIVFNVTVETTGYVGFGLSSNGKMSGADIVVGGVSPNGNPYFSDRHAVGNQLPIEDPNQDWTLIEARESETHTFLSFSRAFDTCDPQDYPITEDKISIIWSFGEKDQLSYHYEKRGVYDAYLLHPDYSPQIAINQSTGQRQVAGDVDPEEDLIDSNHDFEVWTINTVMELPVQDTSYWCTMHKAPELPKKHHIVGLDVRLPDHASRLHTHHLLLHKCNAPRGRSSRSMFHSYLNHRGQECLMVKAPTGPMPTEYCTEFYQSWAVGGRAMFHPPHVGVPLATSKDEYYLLQIHFDNPRLLRGVTVNVSLDMFYTNRLRPNDGGLLMIRHESPGMTPSLHIPPSSIDHNIFGMCGPECTQEFLPRKGVKLYAMLLHSHNAGKEIRLQHFRGKRELPWVLSDENYSFNYQQWRVLTRERQVLPGDQLVVRCIYDNTRVNGTVVGGFSTQQEMCVAFSYYYNKIPDYQQCSSEIDSPWARKYFLGIENVTWSNAHVQFLVSPPNPLAGMTITEVSDNHVEWNLERRDALQRLHLMHPHINRCPRELYAVQGDVRDNNVHNKRKLSDGASENSEDDRRGLLVSYPFGAQPYKPRRSCSFRE